MKLVPAVIFFYVMIISSMIFQGLVPANNSQRIGYDVTSSGGIIFDNNNPNYAIWQMFFDPTKMSSNVIWTILTVSIIGTVTGIVVSLVSKSDLVLLFSVFVIVFASGALALIPFYNIIYADVHSWAQAAGTVNCSATDNYYICQPAILVCALIVGSLAVYWFWVCMEWWSARSAT